MTKPQLRREAKNVLADLKSRRRFWTDPQPDQGHVDYWLKACDDAWRGCWCEGCASTAYVWSMVDEIDVDLAVVQAIIDGLS